ncbi:orotate phosphoribosyltransferase [Halobacteriovorax sp. GB3]|uniref:orotate phosphoribosyltransferase n=1 Tax=Halobacteriovorax sp. GB3 TaxID=2719615 RepID=UPI002360E181|nr:orotate phosphoribosyltransferase [Halobacteriovorax sp. GB3]MDD0851987.1 orotate phosphoribosyltransferase [Halobacteriovorax sp. GB3]
MSDSSNLVAKTLLELKCVQFSPNEPFTYASGLKGPMYCDNRLLLSHPKERSLVIDLFIKVIEENNLSYDQLAGLATAGIPHAAFIADRLKKPMLYIRSKAKGHGKGNQIEGRYKEGERLLLVEDLVNQGSSLEKAVLAAKESALELSGCLSIVDYQMEQAHARLKKFDLTLFSLTDFTSLADTALEMKLIDRTGREILEKWHAAPADWQAPL